MLQTSCAGLMHQKLFGFPYAAIIRAQQFMLMTQNALRNPVSANTIGLLGDITENIMMGSINSDDVHYSEQPEILIDEGYKAVNVPTLTGLLPSLNVWAVYRNSNEAKRKSGDIYLGLEDYSLKSQTQLFLYNSVRLQVL